jgi:hypothetical protein
MRSKRDGQQRPLSRRHRSTDLPGQCAQPIEHILMEGRASRFARDDQGCLTHRPIEVDVELFARLTFLKRRLQYFAQKKLESRSIQPPVRTILFH